MCIVQNIFFNLSNLNASTNFSILHVIWFNVSSLYGINNEVLDFLYQQAVKIAVYMTKKGITVSEN